MLRKIVDLITSLKLTIVCLAAGMALIFAGTLAQVHLGIHEAQQRYFQSMFVWWPPEGRGFQIPIFPGGHLIGAVLLVNLIAAHAKRFRWTWRKLGIHLTHAGLIIMLAGGLFTDLFAVESHMRLAGGDTKNYSEDMRRMELAVIDTSDNDLDQVTAIPDTVLRRNRTIDHWSLPFRIVVRNFYQNSRLKMLNEAGDGVRPIANQGPGAMIAVEPAPRATGVDERDVPERSHRNSAEGRRFVRHVAGVGCARRAADIFLRRPHMDDHAAPVALLQTLQRYFAEVHA